MLSRPACIERWTVHSYLAFATRASWQPPRTDAVCVCLPATSPPGVYPLALPLRWRHRQTPVALPLTQYIIHYTFMSAENLSL